MIRHLSFNLTPRAFIFACPISLFVLALYYNWFAVADRYVIFLYDHLGAGPFDVTTTGRYWMSGLVASGAVMVLYILFNWFAGRIAGLRFNQFNSPPWWQIWLISLPILLLGIPIITMTQNQPTLPLSLARQCTLVALGGLALALLPGSLSARTPSELAWLTLFGVGLVPSLLLLRVVELPGRGYAEIRQVLVVAIGSLLISLLWLGLLVWLRARQRKPVLGALEIFIAGLSFSFLLLPLVHHLFLVPSAFRYISTPANFFAYSPVIQLAGLLVAASLAIGTTRLQQHLLANKHALPQT